jgi:hypothetical protein
MTMHARCLRKDKENYVHAASSKRVGKETHQCPPLNPCTDASAGLKRTVDALCLTTDQIAVGVVA